MNYERRETIEQKEEGKVMDEKVYFDMCVEYAISTGWVKLKEKDVFIEKYLKPIYQKYLETIEEVKMEIASGPDKEILLKKIIKRLNHILERTARIGSTDPGNITRSIDDYYRMFCREDVYIEYAATSLAQFISDLLYSKE